jgi:hypothetical protein
VFSITGLLHYLQAIFKPNVFCTSFLGLALPQIFALVWAAALWGRMESSRPTERNVRSFC